MWYPGCLVYDGEFLAEEVVQTASQKLDEMKGKAAEVVVAAQETAAGKNQCFSHGSRNRSRVIDRSQARSSSGSSREGR